MLVCVYTRSSEQRLMLVYIYTRSSEQRLMLVYIYTRRGDMSLSASILLNDRIYSCAYRTTFDVNVCIHT